MSLYNKIIDLQKLNMAWNRVYKNKPTAGVDNVTPEQFEENKISELKQLHMELINHSYEALPVKNMDVYKGDSARAIALYSMRDKVVQQSLAAELNRIYENQFSEQSYAYRSNHSALTAVNKIEEKIQKGRYSCILKVDIEKFFDSILWDVLQDYLKKTILEEDVLNLIRQNVQTKILDDSGELHQKETGIHQGSAISPVLSNIYLMDFDLWMERQPVFYIRYSDDMIVLGNSKEELLTILKQIIVQLEKKGLKINEEKTFCNDLEKGANFLGYHFGKDGKSIPAKAEKNLNERLEMMWLTSSGLSFENKITKIIKIIGGWEQYFRENRRTESIFEYTALVFGTENKPEYLDTLRERRVSVKNIYKDIAVYLAGIWKKHGDDGMELLEYEQYYQIWDSKKRDVLPNIKQLLFLYQKIMISEETELLTELMQAYTDCREYEKASYWMFKREQSEKMMLKDKNRNVFSIKHSMNHTDIVYDNSTSGKLLQCFAGREDMYSIDCLNDNSKRCAIMHPMPLTEQKLYEHLLGKESIGTYIQRPNGTVRFIVVDIDVSKKILLQYGLGNHQFHSYLSKAQKKAEEILNIFRNFGIQGYLEYSGCRGFHVWLLFTEWIPVRYANMFCDVLDKKLQPEEGIVIEYFPNKTRIKPGKFGQTIKFPCGYHARTGEQSYFIEEDGSKVTELNPFLDNMARFPLHDIKKILAVNTGNQEPPGEKIIDMNLEAFSGAAENVLEVLKKCNLMRYLCQKASKTGYLTHFERLSILYVFGHLGDDGKQFVHQVMSFTLNYQFNITEKFICKIPEKPISCVKLRSQYKKVTAEYGCNCIFKRSKNCYPSPVLHVIALSNDIDTDITVPISRTMGKDREKKVIDELNIHKKAQELAEKILQLKKQKRNLDASIDKIERELEKLYDSAEIDCLEIELGLLVRKKNDKGIEWVIEI